MTDRGSPEWTEIIAEAIDSRLMNVHVSMPGIVVSYDPTKKTVDVQPAITRPIQDEEGTVTFEQLPVCKNVPVAFEGGASFSTSFLLTAGDSVLLVWQDYSIATWRQRGKVSDPADTRHHGPGYPVAVPWYRPDGGAGENEGADPSIGVPGGLRIAFGASAARVGNGADFVALAAKVLAELAAIKAAFDSHTHLYSPGPGAPTPSAPPAVPMPAPGSVASGNLKAD